MYTVSAERTGVQRLSIRTYGDGADCCTECHGKLCLTLFSPFFSGAPGTAPRAGIGVLII